MTDIPDHPDPPAAAEGQWSPPGDVARARPLPPPPPPVPAGPPAIGAPPGGSAPPAADEGIHSLAIAALVLGVLGLALFFVGWVAGLAAIGTGIVARRQAADQGRRGEGMAVAGIVLGVLSLLWIPIVGLLLMSSDDEPADTPVANTTVTESPLWPPSDAEVEVDLPSAGVEGAECERTADADPAAGLRLEHLSAEIPRGSWVGGCVSDGELLDFNAVTREPGDPEHSVVVQLREGHIPPDVVADLPNDDPAEFAEGVDAIVADQLAGLDEATTAAEPMDPLPGTDVCASYRYSYVDRRVPGDEGASWPLRASGIACAATRGDQPVLVFIEWSERIPPDGDDLDDDAASEWLGSWPLSLEVDANVDR